MKYKHLHIKCKQFLLFTIKQKIVLVMLYRIIRKFFKGIKLIIIV